ncbi:mediator complex subunit med21 [Cystoisospora suis]|uniref:Mediator complex subunit med21 n=1 Tax=Cystoisospora suis TaxID=483139 RepID=A0A2C6KWG1_9APIC|nr:mediator complex subunit med21 [Cystoisospora suis]
MFPGTTPPFPSPQASDPITRLQLLLSNFSSHLYDVVQQVPELAPARPFFPGPCSRPDQHTSMKTGQPSSESAGESRVSDWLLRSANNVATIMQAIETEMERLPSSNRKLEDVYQRIAFLEEQNAHAAEELRALSNQASEVRNVVRCKLRHALTEDTNIQVD